MTEGNDSKAREIVQILTNIGLRKRRERVVAECELEALRARLDVEKKHSDGFDGIGSPVAVVERDIDHATPALERAKDAEERADKIVEFALDVFLGEGGDQ